MLLHVAAGAYSEALRMANQFAMHLKVLFSALELVNAMLVAESGLGKKTQRTPHRCKT